MRQIPGEDTCLLRNLGSVWMNGSCLRMKTACGEQLGPREMKTQVQLLEINNISQRNHSPWQSQTRVFQWQHYGHFYGITLCCRGLSCTLGDIEQHLYPLSIRCKQHHHPKTVSRHLSFKSFDLWMADYSLMRTTEADNNTGSFQPPVAVTR